MASLDSPDPSPNTLRASLLLLQSRHKNMRPNTLILSFIAAATFIALLPQTAHADEALVNCSEKRFHSGNSVRSLMGWSNRPFDQATQAKANGEVPADRICEKLINYRGDAHCQERANSTTRKALSDALALCASFRKKQPVKEAPATEAPAIAPKVEASIDCSSKRFQSNVSARGLMGFSNRIYDEVKATTGSGIYPKYSCDELISKRGAAHCKKPADVKIQTALGEAVALCKQLEHPARATKKMMVNCSEKRFQTKVAVPTLLSRSKSTVGNLAQWSSVQAEAKCQAAHSHAGSAHCLLPAEEAPRNELRRVAETCAQDQERRAAMTKAAAVADAAQVAAAKANRKIVKMPRGKGGSTAKQMHKAMLASRNAKTPAEMLKVQVMTGWQSGRFSDTKIPYKKITGMVLWHDKDDDGICRFTSYNFMKTKQGRKWGALAFRSFCNGCAEGWTKCPNKKKRKKK